MVLILELEVEKYWAFPKSYKKDSKSETRNMIFSGDYLELLKKMELIIALLKMMKMILVFILVDNLYVLSRSLKISYSP